MVKKLSFWDILAWIVLAGIFIWLILKAFGIINTPAILEYTPYFGAVYIAGWQIHKLSVVAEDVKELKKFKDVTIRKINDIEMNCKLNHFDKIK